MIDKEDLDIAIKRATEHLNILITRRDEINRKDSKEVQPETSDSDPSTGEQMANRDDNETRTGGPVHWTTSRSDS